MQYFDSFFVLVGGNVVIYTRIGASDGN